MKIEPRELISVLANIGVIAGIVFLAFELRQNNELLAAETRATYASMDQIGWSFIIDNPDLADLLIKDRSGEELTESEKLRLNALWLQNLAQVQFRFLQDPDSTGWINGQRRSYESYSTLRSAWDGDGAVARQAGKDNFDPRFVRFYDENIVVSQ